MPEYKLPELEEVLCEAIVRRFFEPAVSGYSMQPGAWVNGVQEMVSVPSYREAPLAAVTRQMYADNVQDLATRIWEKLDVDALAANVAEQMAAKLFEGRRTNWDGLSTEPYEVKALKAEVNKRLAEELTRRALAKLDADEAAASPKTGNPDERG